MFTSAPLERRPEQRFFFYLAQSVRPRRAGVLFPRAARCVHVFLGVVLLSKTISVYQQNRFGCRCERERVEGIWDYQTAACVIWTCAAITQNRYVRLLVLLWMCRVSSWSVGAVTSGGTSRKRVEGVATLGVNLQINLFSIQHRRLQNSVRTRDKKTTC